MHDPMTLMWDSRVLSVWHRDKGGVDGACDWGGTRLTEEEREFVRQRAGYLMPAQIDGAVVGWALAKGHNRPWYRNPRMHVHHWRIQVHPVRLLRRALRRCCLCRRRFGWSPGAIVADWGGSNERHWYCERAATTRTEAP